MKKKIEVYLVRDVDLQTVLSNHDMEGHKGCALKDYTWKEWLCLIFGGALAMSLFMLATAARDCSLAPVKDEVQAVKGQCLTEMDRVRDAVLRLQKEANEVNAKLIIDVSVTNEISEIKKEALECLRKMDQLRSEMVRTLGDGNRQRDLPRIQERRSK